ncbi:MAG: hypothetical protein ACR2F8_01585 [Caulobacteraceae bacterium]
MFAGGKVTNGTAGTVTNFGAIEAIGFNASTDLLEVEAHSTFVGAVLGGGGTLDLASSFTQNVTFTGATGELGLAQSQGYTGSISGFSKTGGTSLDLGDIAFGGSTKATYAGTSKSGVLTVADGTHTANITLIGNYAKATFTTSSDGHGGTIVVDPKTGASAALSTSAAGAVQTFIAAASAMGAGESASGQAMAAHVPLAAPPTLAAPPRGCFA